MTLFNILSCAIISVGIGRGYPRVLAVGAFIALLYFNQPEIGYIIAWLYAFAVIRLLPTGGLFLAINNDPPVYDGSKIEGAIYRLTMLIWKRLPDSMTSWYVWGIIYGFVRTLPVIPAAIYLGEPVLYLAPLIGVVYWFSGQMLGNTTKAVAVAEIVVGGMIGAAV